MSNNTTPDFNLEPSNGPDAFLAAAHVHAADMLAEKGEIYDVMILGRYADQDLLFVFPSAQDREQYAQACTQQAAEFGADIAMMVADGQLNLTRTVDGAEVTESTPCAVIYWRERTGPTRVQYAVVAGQQLGPMQSLMGIHHNAFVDVVFPTATH